MLLIYITNVEISNFNIQLLNFEFQILDFHISDVGLFDLAKLLGPVGVLGLVGLLILAGTSWQLMQHG